MLSHILIGGGSLTQYIVNILCVAWAVEYQKNNRNFPQFKSFLHMETKCSLLTSRLSFNLDIMFQIWQIYLSSDFL